MTEAVHGFVGEAEQSDDLTMMAILYDRKDTDHLPDSTGKAEIHHSITLPNDIEKVPELHDFVNNIAEDAELDPSLSMSIDLAIEEAVVNVMNYAYPQGTKGTVNIVGTIEDNWLQFVITDTGIPFDPTVQEDADTTLSAEDRPIGGLGIFMVRQIMDSVSYERTEGKNVLTLKKDICVK
jgi:sigma-B regulation protein RsbU (phosphoserine phosphatase)